MRKKLLLVDASNQFHRAFYSPSVELSAPDGFPTTALHGFFNIITSIENKYQPDYLLLVFDKGKSFRNDIFQDYKGNRPSKTPEFSLQWDEIVPLAEALGYPCYKKDDGYEADDLIGTLAMEYEKELDVIIFSSDKDFAQLVTDNIYLLQPKQPVGYAYRDRANIEKKYGLPVSMILDLFTLIGDTADNVPGIPGVGQKTALKYLEKYGTWRGVVENAAEIGGKRGQQIAAATETVALANRLIQIDTQVSHNLSIEMLQKNEPKNDIAYEKALRFGLKKLVQQFDLQAPNTIDYSSVSMCKTLQELEQFLDAVEEGTNIGVDMVFSSGSFVQRQPLVISLAYEQGNNSYLSVVPEEISDQWKQDLEPLWDVLENRNIGKICHNSKHIISWMRGEGLPFAGLQEDLLLLDYLDGRFLNHRDHSLVDISRRLLSMQIKSLDEHSETVPKAWLEELAKERIFCIWALRESFHLSDGMRKVYREIEIPCVSVLAEMEHHGICVSVDQFQSFIVEIEEKLTKIEAFIENDIGRTINIRSPKQLSQLLYQEKGYTPTKKTKSGGSTDSASLQELMQQVQDPILQKILDYRELHKVKSTYLEALPNYVDVDGRIHTQLHQAVTATGRLSSSEPNLQNIPVRKEWGKKIRSCFIPEKGKVLISADYSQIEMRILAHYCQKGNLVESFQKGEDVHRRTGIELAGGELFYTPSHRNIAKMINYGLIYGMSSFRLARELNIPRKDAENYIERYFQGYPEVRRYLDQSIADARTDGVSKTLWGRERIILGINSEDTKKKEAAERIALNAPIQGTAADIMKSAMITVFNNLRTNFPTAKLLLQIHDELLIEVEENLANDVASLLQKDMESAGALDVPITVNVDIGNSWSAIH